MTDPDQPRQRESIVGLGRRLVSGMVQLARLELTRGRQEVGEMLSETMGGVLMFAIAAALALLALLSLDAAIVLGLAALFDAIVDVAVVIIIVATFVLVAIGFAIAGVVSAVVIIGLLVVAAVFAVPAYFGFTAAWLTALFVLAVEASLAAIFVMRGIRKVHIGPPEETIAAVKEDMAWAKRLLRRE